jgi:hypothetical protein
LATDKFIWKADDLVVAACVTCKHKRDGATCAAFPRGIPRQILSGDNPHTEPVDGDHGIQFEKVVSA